MRCPAPILVVFEALTLKQKLYYYQGTPFTGVAVHTANDIVQKNQVFELGKPQGDYISPFLNMQGPGVLDSIDAIEEQDWDGNAPLIIQGTPFTGFVYVLGGDRITDLEYCLDGLAQGQGMSQHFAGGNCYSELYYTLSDMKYNYAWYEPDILSRYRAGHSEVSKESLTLYFHADGMLSSIDFSYGFKAIFKRNNELDQATLTIDSFKKIEPYFGEQAIELDLYEIKEPTLTEILSEVKSWPIEQVFFNTLSLQHLTALKKISIPILTCIKFFQLKEITLNEVLAFRDKHLNHIKVKYGDVMY
ncbi:MAG: hypothetical protein ACJASU_000969 [Cognaticolwellia sp.]|jgi:hypothetical protein